MAAKGLFESLSVAAQARIIDLFASTIPRGKDVLLEWHTTRSLNERYGVGAVSELSKETFSISRKQVNPPLDDLVDVIFTAGDKLTILVTMATLGRGRRYKGRYLNPGTCMAVVQRFLDTKVKVCMREFHIRSHDWDPLRWPEAARGRVRPCPQCSIYEMEESNCVGGVSGYRYAYKTFHFHNQTTAQWLTVELRLTDAFM
ncbi:hypothetical protein AAVH_41289 [Aphelenchoides avenae]|nr:hypothetical protein AAVH_41289 [Aphelenchus avenae]